MSDELKYRVGDSVKIVKYGHPVWEHKAAYPDPYKGRCPIIFENEQFRVLDIAPELIGRSGIVVIATLTQGQAMYSIDGIGSWYVNNQLELIDRK